MDAKISNIKSLPTRQMVKVKRQNKYNTNTNVWTTKLCVHNLVNLYIVYFIIKKFVLRANKNKNTNCVLNQPHKNK